MVSSLNSSQSSSILAGLSHPQTTPSGSTSSFTDQLAAALEGYLAQSGNGSNLEIDIQSTQSQNSGVRQFIVTVKNPAGAPAQASSTASASANPPASSAPASSPQASAGQAAVHAASPAPAGAPGAPVDEATQVDEIRAEEDAYWAAQPPAVQQLRNIPDFRDRGIMAQQLADQGYTIDKAVMVWGWDPLKTMLTRQMYGYTWVPNLNQPSASPGPGFTLPGETPYDPNNPPAGSIAVNTNFASTAQIADAWS